MNTISTLEIHLHAHAFNMLLAKRSPLVNTSYNANYSKMHTPQIPINTALAKRNPPHFKHAFLIQNVKPTTGRETQFCKTNFPVISGHCNHSCNSQLLKK